MKNEEYNSKYFLEDGSELIRDKRSLNEEGRIHKAEIYADVVCQKLIPKENIHLNHDPRSKNQNNKNERKISNALLFNINSFIDRLEGMKPNNYIFNKLEIEHDFGELILNTNKKEWNFVLFSRVLESIYGIMKWREYQLHHIAFDDAYLSNYKIADPDCGLDRHRFAATYCGALDDLKAKADSMIYSVIEYYLPMFDDVEENEEEGEDNE